MTYPEALTFLFNSFPTIQKNGWDAYKPGLERVNLLSELLNHPHQNYPCVHIAGTNGKGSVSHLIASILQESGYKVGLFTSPHLKDFRERIKVNGQEIPEQRVVDFVQEFSKEAKIIDPSFFEYTAMLAFLYFNEQKVDIAIIETGLGGRLDCTNIITPILSVITNIGLDHTQFLGTTLTEIASEKAGIIKTKIPVVVGRKNSQTDLVFINTAITNKSSIYFASELDDVNYEIGLKGNYQKENLKTVRKSIELLQNLFWKINETHVVNGLKNVIRNTNLMGRWQVLSENPTVICDVAHNEDGVKQIVKQLLEFKNSELHIVWGMSKDKNIFEILSLLPKNAKYYWCSANNSRSMDANELKESAVKMGLNGNAYSTVIQAFENAKTNASEKALVFVGGSVFVVAEIL